MENAPCPTRPPGPIQRTSARPRRGHFYLAQKGTFLLCVDTPAVATASGWRVGSIAGEGITEVSRNEAQQAACRRSLPGRGRGATGVGRGRERATGRTRHRGDRRHGDPPRDAPDGHADGHRRRHRRGDRGDRRPGDGRGVPHGLGAQHGRRGHRADALHRARGHLATNQQRARHRRRHGRRLPRRRLAHLGARARAPDHRQPVRHRARRGAEGSPGHPVRRERPGRRRPLYLQVARRQRVGRGVPRRRLHDEMVGRQLQRLQRHAEHPDHRGPAGRPGRAVRNRPRRLHRPAHRLRTPGQRHGLSDRAADLHRGARGRQLHLQHRGTAGHQVLRRPLDGRTGALLGVPGGGWDGLHHRREPGRPGPDRRRPVRDQRPGVPRAERRRLGRLRGDACDRRGGLRLRGPHVHRDRHGPGQPHVPRTRRSRGPGHRLDHRVRGQHQRAAACWRCRTPR